MKQPQRFEPNVELSMEDVKLMDLSNDQPLLNLRGHRPAIQSAPGAGLFFVKPSMYLHGQPRVSEVVADDQMRCVAVHMPDRMITDGHTGG